MIGHQAYVLIASFIRKLGRKTISILTMMSCAIEDDAIWVCDVDFEISKSECHIIRESAPRYMEGRKFDPKGEKDDQHIIDMDVILESFAEAIRNVGRPVHCAGLSTFGNVDAVTGNFFFRPIEMTKEGPHPFCAPQHLERLTGIPASNVIVANDASAATVGEWARGIGRGTDDFGYVWAGRGVNAGLILGGQPWLGRLHPEAGHILVRRDDGEPDFEGVCPDHRGCILGLACVRAIRQRLNSGMSLEDVSDLMGYYYAQLCLDVSLMVAPERIAMGGILMDRFALPGLLDNTRRHFKKLKGRYPAYPIQAKDTFIVAAEAPYASLWGLVEMMRRKLTPDDARKARP